MTLQSMIPLNDFREARRRAATARIVARLIGRSDDLLSYEDVRQKLHAQVNARRELRDIPLDAIVGSVGRYSDFNRQFLPRNPNDAERWARVKRAMETLEGVPPIEAYQIGDAYFVLDGNHRVSVARETGATHIQGYVTELKSRVPFSATSSPDDLIHKAEYADFLELTNLDRTRPNADLSVTAAGQYTALENAIQAQRLHLAAQQGHEVSIEAAAADWYDTIYMPTIQIIRDQNLLADFPNRTETDLYVWLSSHRAALKQELGWEIDHDAAARDLAGRFGARPGRVMARVGERLLDAVTPAALESGPRPGQWRRDRGVAAPKDRLSVDLLVPVSGEPAGWLALDQALLVARYEGGRIGGLHVLASETARSSPAAHAVQAEFDRRCAEAGVAGNLVLEVGKVTDVICERARWHDLVVVSLSYPPGTETIARLRSGFRALVQRSPLPVLAVPGPASALRHGLLAYDGSPKADEALFIATYMAHQWGMRLTVLSVLGGAVTAATHEHARHYLEAHEVQASFVVERGPVAPAILKAAEANGCDLTLIGGYGAAPLLEVVLGSAVDQVLRESHTPTLICR